MQFNYILYLIFLSYRSSSQFHAKFKPPLVNKCCLNKDNKQLGRLSRRDNSHFNLMKKSESASPSLFQSKSRHLPNYNTKTNLNKRRLSTASGFNSEIYHFRSNSLDGSYMSKIICSHIIIFYIYAMIIIILKLCLI